MAQPVVRRDSQSYQGSPRPNTDEGGRTVDGAANRLPRSGNRLRKWLAGVVVAGAVLAVPLGLMHKSEQEAQAQRDKTEQEVLRNATSKDKIVVFHKGVKYRATPHTVNDAQVGIGNINGEVESALVVQKPVEYTDDIGNTWIGFQIQGEAANSRDMGQIGYHTYWVNYSEVNRQQRHPSYEGDQPLVTTYSQPASESPSNISVSFDEQGVMRSSTTGEGVGISMFMDDTAAQFLLNSLDTVRS